MTLSIITLHFLCVLCLKSQKGLYVECRYADCRYAECCCAMCRSAQLIPWRSKLECWSLLVFVPLTIVTLRLRKLRPQKVL